LPIAEVNYFNFDFKFFNCLGVIYFAYTNQSQLMPIYKELADPTKPRVTKVIWRSTWTVAFFYTLTPIFGYLSTLSNTPTVIVTRPTAVEGAKDYFQILAVFAVMSVLLVKCLCMIMPFKQNVYQLIYGSSELTTKANWTICALFCAFTCFLSIVFPKVSAVLGIFGGISSVNICFLVPLIIYVQLSKEHDSWKSPKNLAAITVFSLFCIGGWLAVASSVNNLL
jgi:amino acid permease